MNKDCYLIAKHNSYVVTQQSHVISLNSRIHITTLSVLHLFCIYTPIPLNANSPYETLPYRLQTRPE